MWGEKGCTHCCKATRDDKRSSLRTAAAAPTLLRACIPGAADLRDGETETGEASRPDSCGTGQYKCSLEQVRSTALTSGGVRDGPGTFHHINRSCCPRTGTSKLPLSLGDFHAGNWRLWSVQHCHRVGSPATFSAPPCPNPDCATSVSLPHQSTPSPLFTSSTLFPAPQPPSARHCIILGSEIITTSPISPATIIQAWTTTPHPTTTTLLSRSPPSLPRQRHMRSAVLLSWPA